MEKLKDKWWRKRIQCEKVEDQADGISIQNIGGVFIVIFIGIGMACITLVFEYWWYKHRKATPKIIDVAENVAKKPGENDLIISTNVHDGSPTEINNSVLRSRNVNHSNLSGLKY